MECSGRLPLLGCFCTNLPEEHVYSNEAPECFHWGPLYVALTPALIQGGGLELLCPDRDSEQFISCLLRSTATFYKLVLQADSQFHKWFLPQNLSRDTSEIIYSCCATCQEAGSTSHVKGAFGCVSSSGCSWS